MSDEIPLNNSPLAEGDPLDPHNKQEQSSHLREMKGEGSKSVMIWERLSQVGMVEPFLRTGTHLVLIILVFVVIWGMRSLYLNTQPEEDVPQEAALAAPLPTLEPTPIPPQLPSFTISKAIFRRGIPRLALLHTTIPTRPRVNVFTYTVQTGDSVFGIADKFGLKPETIFWGNYGVLEDNPHRLRPGQVLTILPTNGTYHKWSAGENLQKVAEYYGVESQAIIEWSGNPLDPYNVDVTDPGINPGTMIIVPGGQKALVDWGPPRIPRDNPAVARTYGPGFCGSVYDGPIGSGSYIWPTTEHWISGYDYSPGSNHPAIDIAGSIGNPVWSVDNGVVVYAGWSNYGYGNLIAVDHGNGWQSYYAHLNDIYVSCGQGVFQGTAIGALGNTGNSSGAHLHFELMYNAVKVNPWNFLP